jgi:GNAT superfamily N-acetyltransferase
VPAGFTLIAMSLFDAVFTWRRDGVLCTTERARFDLDAAMAFIARSYWAPGMPREVMARAIEHSLVFSLHDEAAGKMIGMARVISDCATFAYLSDVFVDEAYRGRGLSKWLLTCIDAHPGLAGHRRQMLMTKDAHSLYAGFGYTPLAQPEWAMERLDLNVYSKPT